MATVDVDIKKLLEAGAHFGHKTSRWHPKMAPYIHSKRAGSHIIDLTKTVSSLEDALDFVAKTVGEGKQILFVGTKEAKMSTGELSNKYNKLEVQRFQEEIDDMNLLYGGIKDMAARPGAVVIFDLVHDANAVREARKLNVPIVALVDTNADPTLATYPVPSNDDAIKTIQLMADYFQQAVEQGKAKRAKATPDKDEAKKVGEK